MKTQRYLVYACYPNLGIPVRVTDYSNKAEMYEYINGLRFCNTAYLAFDTRTNKTLDFDYGDIGKEKMIEMMMTEFNISEDDING